ncbi:integral membrane protein GPR180-like isoform X2 [Babylonia areolata]
MKWTSLHIFLGVAVLLPISTALHLQGTWNSKDFFVFLAKFGFQKTNPQRLDDTQGYIYGNITAVDASGAAVNREDLTLVVVDSEYFIHFYGNRTLRLTEVCPVMFQKIDTIAFDYMCNAKGVEDFLRAIPCPKGRLCSDEDNPANVLPGYQFTFKVRDTEQPRFWYLSIVSCSRDRGHKDCQWRPGSMTEPLTIAYDVWLVNGDPSSKALNPFEHQFSFEFHDVFEIHLVAFLLISVILALWTYAFLKQKHMITKLLTVVFAGELLSTTLSLTHVAVFAYNGQGVDWMSKVGTLVDIGVQCLFMMFLLLLAKGWGITTDQLKWKSVLFGICGVYTVLNLFLYIWNLVEIDNIISNTDEWQTWPGYATLAFRLIAMVWFVVELRRTFHHTPHDHLSFIQHFGAFFLMWFIYLPVLALISTQVSPLWRYKTILSISYAVDIFAYAVLLHLFWPSRSVLFMVNGERPLPIYDLEITGLLEDMQETTLFTRNDKEPPADLGKEEGQPHSPHTNGDTVTSKPVLANGSARAPTSPNGHVNTSYKDEFTSDEENT